MAGGDEKQGGSRANGDPVTDLLAEMLALEAAFRAEIAPLGDEPAIRAAQARFLGKKGRLSELMKRMGQLPAPERPRVGETANRVKGTIEGETDRRLAALVALQRTRDLARIVDVTLPGRPAPRGHLHVVTQARRDLIAIFTELGFQVAHGPQIETDYHNFQALAMGPDHPARDATDTFYVGHASGRTDLLLRTHTSPIQIRTMLSHRPPIRVIAPGTVFRRDDDATHSPMFSQLEALVIDDGIRMSDLKGTLLHFIRGFFGDTTLGVRFRSSYFPFVEPGAEADMTCAFCRGRGCRICKQTGWIEIGGSGMVDPRVLGECGIDAERYTGFAFGMGIERMAMLRHDIPDIKHFYEGDVRFARQFP